MGFEAFQSDHVEDFIGPQGIRMGCGWVGVSKTDGYVAVDTDQQLVAVLPAEAQVALARSDAAAKREASEQEARRQERAEGRMFRARQLGYQPMTHAEVLAGASMRMDRLDRVEQTRIRAAISRGDLELSPPAPPTLRSERFTMAREQAERAEAAAARPVQGSELDDLRAEVTRLKTLLNSQGIRAV